MRFFSETPPRSFRVGINQAITLMDCGRIQLDNNELVTFITESGTEYDVTRKEWGYYATPSLNGRLPGFGLRPVLVRNEALQYYVFLAERGKEALFDDYVASERLTVVTWLEDTGTLKKVEKGISGTFDVQEPPAPSRCLCGALRFRLFHEYLSPPEGEIDYGQIREGTYRRELLRCESCGHFVSNHAMDLSGLYEADYVTATYGEDGLRQAYEKIMALDPSHSDNVGRVRWISEAVVSRLRVDSPRRLLDVGSGLCVFPAAFKELGWECTALDPDPRSTQHADEHVEIKGVNGDFMEMDLAGLDNFELVTFNKVLEHVPDPVAMLKRTHDLLAPEGLVYVEVPDGEAAVDVGVEREEFFIDHLHVFSPASAVLLATRAGFRPLTLETVREPSSKFTIRMLLVPTE